MQCFRSSRQQMINVQRSVYSQVEMREHDILHMTENKRERLMDVIVTAQTERKTQDFKGFKASS